MSDWLSPGALELEVGQGRDELRAIIACAVLAGMERGKRETLARVADRAGLILDLVAETVEGVSDQQARELGEGFEQYVRAHGSWGTDEAYAASKRRRDRERVEIDAAWERLTPEQRANSERIAREIIADLARGE